MRYITVLAVMVISFLLPQSIINHLFLISKHLCLILNPHTHLFSSHAHAQTFLVMKRQICTEAV